MKKTIFYSLLLLTLLASCGGKSDKEKELELRERELALKEKELALNSANEPSNQIKEEITYAPPKEKSEAELKRELYQRE